MKDFVKYQRLPMALIDSFGGVWKRSETKGWYQRINSHKNIIHTDFLGCKKIMFKKQIPREKHKDYKILKRYPNGDIKTVKRLTDNKIFNDRTWFRNDLIKIKNHYQHYNNINAIVEHDDLTISVVLKYERMGERKRFQSNLLDIV